MKPFKHREALLLLLLLSHRKYPHGWGLNKTGEV